MNASWIVLLALVLIGIFLASRAWPARGARGSALDANGDTDEFQGPTLSIATYNIHRARGTDGRKNLDRIADVLRACDVVALQEVEGTSPLRRHDQAYRLGRLLDRATHFSPTRRLLFFAQRGNALVSRFQATGWQTTPLSPSTGRAHRNLTVYRFELGGLPLVVINTHLSKPAKGEVPLEAVMHTFAGYPRAVLVGDFNAGKEDPAMRRWIPADAKDALAGLDDKGRVDMIFVRGLKIEDAWSQPAGPSDHPFFAARIRVVE
ncbi:MAG TPA: hypothetical protein DG761_11930 [Gammaproteobacteria bacterium]|nr:hypothetical protein [Gammaproteobacteria bacterium]